MFQVLLVAADNSDFSWGTVFWWSVMAVFWIGAIALNLWARHRRREADRVDPPVIDLSRIHGPGI